MSVCMSVYVSRTSTAAWLQALLAEYMSHGDTLKALVHPSVCLSVCLPVLPVCPLADNLANEDTL